MCFALPKMCETCTLTHLAQSCYVQSVTHLVWWYIHVHVDVSLLFIYIHSTPSKADTPGTMLL